MDGADLVRVPKVLAFYRRSAVSMSTNVLRMDQSRSEIFWLYGLAKARPQILKKYDLDCKRIYFRATGCHAERTLLCSIRVARKGLLQGSRSILFECFSTDRISPKGIARNPETVASPHLDWFQK